jgi:hypothetical protein
LKHLTFKKSCFAFFLVLAPCSLVAFPCHHETLTYLNPLPFVLDLVPIIWSNIWFLYVVFSFTLAVRMTFVFNALHHLHEALVGVWNLHPLVDNFLELRFQSMQEGQLSSKLLKGDDN